MELRSLRDSHCIIRPIFQLPNMPVIRARDRVTTERARQPSAGQFKARISAAGSCKAFIRSRSVGCHGVGKNIIRGGRSESRQVAL